MLHMKKSRNWIKRIPSPNISQRLIHEFLYILQFNKLLKSNFCIIVFQRDLDFKISVKFEGEISEVEEETKYKMR